MAKFKNYEDYIAGCQPFARPILNHLRECVHLAGDNVQEEFKWGFPNFTYKGQILCNMAGFNQHVSFGFWLGSLMEDPESILINVGDSGMGQFGKIKSLEDLPSKEIIIEYIRQAMCLTNEGKKLSSGKKKEAKALPIPSVFSDLLKDNPAAVENFNQFSTSKRNEYVEWITEAKTETTREKRLAQSIEWIAEGKPRNWKYMKKW